MRFVSVKTDVQLDIQAVHRVRSYYVKQRTGLMNMFWSSKSRHIMVYWPDGVHGAQSAPKPSPEVALRLVSYLKLPQLQSFSD